MSLSVGPVRSFPGVIMCVQRLVNGWRVGSDHTDTAWLMGDQGRVPHDLHWLSRGLSASEAIFGAGTYSHNLFSPVILDE